MNSHSTIAPATPLEALKAEIVLRRQEFQGLRHIPIDIVRRFQEVGVYRAFVPKRFGGDGLTPQAFCRLVEEIATADASAGWVASFGVSATYLASLPPETYAAIYGKDPNTVFAGAMFPPQLARRVMAASKSAAAGPGVRASWAPPSSEPASRWTVKQARCPARPSCRATR